MFPIQHVMRYDLHLKTVLKNTDPKHPDHAKIQEAISYLGEWVKNVDEQQVQNQATDLLMSLLEMIQNFHAKCMRPGRQEISQFKCKMSHGGGPGGEKFQLTRAQLFLMNDSIIVADRRKGDKAAKLHGTLHRKWKLSESKPFVFRDLFLLEEARVFRDEPSGSEDREMHYFVIESLLESRPLAEGSSTQQQQLGIQSMRFAASSAEEVATFIESCQKQRVIALSGAARRMSETLEQARLTADASEISRLSELLSKTHESLGQEQALTDDVPEFEEEEAPVDEGSAAVEQGTEPEDRPAKSGLRRKPSFYTRYVRRSKSTANLKRGKISLDTPSKGGSKENRSLARGNSKSTLPRAQTSLAILSGSGNNRRRSSVKYNSSVKSRSGSVKSFESHPEE